MGPIRLAVGLVVAALALGAVVGCGKVADSLERIAETKEPYIPGSIVPVDAPDASLASGAVVATAAHSVVKISSVAPACQKMMEGSGFVFAPHRVMSSAHVVAGASSFTVSVDGQEHPATVVVFDPNTDISVLDVPGLEAPPLALAENVAPTGTDAVILGYPGGGPFVATPARIREVIDLSGPDLYRTTTVSREVYIIRGKVGQGSSGGPLIDLNSRVLGMGFGASVDDPDTGFVITAGQVSARVASDAETRPVATGACVS